MKKQKLNYRFHNPNTAAVTADYLLKILIEANSEKVEKAIQTAADQLPDEPERDEGRPVFISSVKVSRQNSFILKDSKD